MMINCLFKNEMGMHCQGEMRAHRIGASAASAFVGRWRILNAELRSTSPFAIRHS
jgi:hypothetical protein